jgi:hypothetical protein
MAPEVYLRRFLEKNVPLVGAHRDAPLPEILNQSGHLFPENVLDEGYPGSGLQRKEGFDSSLLVAVLKDKFGDR